MQAARSQEDGLSALKKRDTGRERPSGGIPLSDLLSATVLPAGSLPAESKNAENLLVQSQNPGLYRGKHTLRKGLILTVVTRLPDKCASTSSPR